MASTGMELQTSLDGIRGRRMRRKPLAGYAASQPKMDDSGLFYEQMDASNGPLAALRAAGIAGI